jgi:ProQ/FINO family
LTGEGVSPAVVSVTERPRLTASRADARRRGGDPDAASRAERNRGYVDLAVTEFETMSSPPASNGRLVAGAATIAVAQKRGIATPPQKAGPTEVPPPSQRQDDIDQPVAVAGDRAITTAQPSPAPSRRILDPDRHLKFGDLLRGLRATCEAFSEPPRPLAIGIDKQIAELVGDQFERWVIVKVLRWWCARPDYLQALAGGGERIHLDGSSAGEISDRDRAGAEQRLVEWRRRNRR